MTDSSLPASATPPPGNASSPAPQRLTDHDLEKQAAEHYRKAQEKILQQAKDAQGKTYIEEFEKIRKLGFVSAKDVEELLSKREAALAEREAKIDKLWAELMDMRVQMNLPRNSGMLDGQKPPEPKNRYLAYLGR